MAELKITLTEQDLARLPKNVSAALLEYLKKPQPLAHGEAGLAEASLVRLRREYAHGEAGAFEYAPDWMPISLVQKQRKLKVVSVDEALELGGMLFDQELPVFRKFFQNEPNAQDESKVFDELGNWGAFGALAFLCGLDGPRKICASVTLNEMMTNMQGFGLNPRYSNGKSLSPLIKQVRRALNEFYHTDSVFHLFATTGQVSPRLRSMKPSAVLVFATGTREAFKEALTKIVNDKDRPVAISNATLIAQHVQAGNAYRKTAKYFNVSVAAVQRAVLGPNRPR